MLRLGERGLGGRVMSSERGRRPGVVLPGVVSGRGATRAEPGLPGEAVGAGVEGWRKGGGGVAWGAGVEGGYYREGVLEESVLEEVRHDTV